MTERRRGMDHDLYPYSPIGTRPALHWPNRAAVAANVVLHFEYWELDPPEGALRDPRCRDPIADLFPAYRVYSWREYGNRAGIFRILALLDRLKLPVTVAANSAACERYPYLVTEFLRRGYEFAAHGTHASRMINAAMSAADERAVIAQALDQLERATGRRPTGWVGQYFGETPRTPHLLAEAGLDYLMDWPNDDQPYAMTVGRGLVSIPIQAEWDEVQALWSKRVLSTRFPKIVGEAMDVLRQEGRQSGRYFGLHIHPWISGKAHRFPYLARALEQLSKVSDVWWATAAEVSRAFRDQRPAS
jgi:peptidoglycan/xylan/chitin deacetylase (PgdA/CDA1 family)